VVLLKDLAGIGKEGDIKEVADGFARNYLFPNNLAVVASKENIKRVDTKKKKREKEERLNFEAVQNLANELDGREFVFKVKEKDGKLFGSINNRFLSRELKKCGYDLNPENFVVDPPIKELGEYDVNVNLDHGLEAMIKVILEREE